MGSRGDVQPYVALGKGLAAEGHAVRIATLEPFRGLVESHGLGFRSVPSPLSGLDNSLAWRKWQASDSALWEKLLALRTVLRDARPNLSQNFESCVEACRGSDVIVSSFTGFVGPYVAGIVGALHIWALLQPCTPTGEHPYFLSPWQSSRSRLFNLASHCAAGAVFRWLFAALARDWHPDGAVAVPGRHGPLIYGFSPVLIPRPKDWGSNIQITGDWRLDAASGWTPPEQLLRYLAGEERPACVCHGAITGWRSPEAGLDLLVKALRISGLRGIVVSRLAGSGIERISDSCVVIDGAPFDWLFPRTALILHHGGAGTTAAALRAGRPCVVLPSCFDQRFWANAVRRLGAAVRPLDPHRASPGTLARAMREASSNGDYAANAERCGNIMAGEDGVRRAVETLRCYLAKSDKRTGGR